MRSLLEQCKSGLLRSAALLMRACALHERRCAACASPFIPEAASSGRSTLFCERCRPSFRWREAGYCPYCGEPSAVAEAPVVPCGECLQKLPPWNEFLFCGIYEGKLRELILRAKFGGSLAGLDALGHLLAERCAEHYDSAMTPQVIVPVPLHPTRLRERGFDQCLEIARPVARALGLPLRADLLRKIVPTRPQEGLSRESRRELRQPFSASPEVSGLRILLLDDVCTTGSTLARAAESLLASGALSVDVAVVARASRHTTAERPAESGVARTLP